MQVLTAGWRYRRDALTKAGRDSGDEKCCFGMKDLQAGGVGMGTKWGMCSQFIQSHRHVEFRFASIHQSPVALDQG